MRTIDKIYTNEIIIKNSRFITILFPINSDNITELINKVKIDYPKATHYCYSYILENHQKASDDGEPGGTAGMPMLNVLKMQGLTNIIAIVTRYFGGIKLGAGGLTRAYSQSVAETLKLAEIVEKELVPL